MSRRRRPDLVGQPGRELAVADELEPERLAAQLVGRLEHGGQAVHRAPAPVLDHAQRLSRRRLAGGAARAGQRQRAHGHHGELRRRHAEDGGVVVRVRPGVGQHHVGQAERHPVDDVGEVARRSCRRPAARDRRRRCRTARRAGRRPARPGGSRATAQAKRHQQMAGVADDDDVERDAAAVPGEQREVGAGKLAGELARARRRGHLRRRERRVERRRVLEHLGARRAQPVDQDAVARIPRVVGAEIGDPQAHALKRPPARSRSPAVTATAAWAPARAPPARPPPAGRRGRGGRRRGRRSTRRAPPAPPPRRTRARPRSRHACRAPAPG